MLAYFFISLSFNYFKKALALIVFRSNESDFESGDSDSAEEDGPAVEVVEDMGGTFLTFRVSFFFCWVPTRVPYDHRISIFIFYIFYWISLHFDDFNRVFQLTDLLKLRGEWLRLLGMLHVS